MDTPLTFAATPPATASSRSSSIRSLLSRNRPQGLARFLPRVKNVTSNAPTASAAQNVPETIQFESLFSDTMAATVMTPENEAVSLIEHVQSRNAAGEVVLLGWLRHFGCSLCKKQTSDWMSIQSELENCGKVCMTLVGNGPLRHAADFIEDVNWEGYLFTDPDRRTYKALQFRAGILCTFNLPALGKVISSFREGNKQTWKRIPTDAFQQGGSVLVDTNGDVRIFHADAFAGDHFDKDQLVREICAIAQ